MRWRRATRDIRGPPGSEPPACTFTDPSPASRLILRLRSSWNGPHDPDVSAAPRVDPERLDGLPTRAAGEGPRGVRSAPEQIEAAFERRELLRPPRPVDPGPPLDPPGDGTGYRGAETGTFFGRGRYRAPCGFVRRPSPTAWPPRGSLGLPSI